MKKIFSLIAAVLFAGSMMADVVTINASDITTITSGATSGLDVTLQGIQIAWEGAYYNNEQGSDMRVYANKSMTLTASANITKVEIAGYCKAGFTATVNAGTITTGASYTDATTKADLEDPLIVIDNIGAQSVAITGTKQLQVRTLRVTLGAAPAVATPVISGNIEFSDSVIVTMSCTTPNSDIYYTTDGTTDPKCDCAAAPEYTHPIVIKETTTIMAAAYTGNDWSAVATKTFTKVVGPKNLGPKTIAEFLALKNTTDTCILTGVIDSLVNTTYGNFNLVDATGKVYIYGLLNAAGESKKFAELGVEEGDTLTVKAIYAEYNNAPQVKNAIFVSAKRQPAPSPIDHTYFAYDNDWKADTLSSATWDGVNKKVIVNIALAKQAAWQAQVFVQDILGKEGYEYAISLKMKANKAVNGVTVKYQNVPNDTPMFYRNDIALAANTEFVLDTAHLVGNEGDGQMVFDFGFAEAETVIEIYDIQITETKLATPATCAEIYSMAKNDPVAMGNVTVTYVSGKNVWVADETGAMLLYLSADATWKAGDVLAGVAGTVDIYNGVYEVKPSAEQVAAVVATAGEAPAPEELTAVAAADMNKYIVVKGIAFEQDAAFAEGTASNITIKVGGNDIVLRNNFKNAFEFKAGKAYDIIAVVTIYQSNPQLYFISASEAQGIENIELTEQAQKVMVDGIMYIVRDGKMFNAQGIQVR